MWVGLQESSGGGRAECSGSLGRPIWFSTRPWRALALSTLDGVDLEPKPCHHLMI